MFFEMKTNKEWYFSILSYLILWGGHFPPESKDVSLPWLLYNINPSSMLYLLNWIISSRQFVYDTDAVNCLLNFLIIFKPLHYVQLNLIVISHTLFSKILVRVLQRKYIHTEGTAPVFFCLRKPEVVRKTTTELCWSFPYWFQLYKAKDRFIEDRGGCCPFCIDIID